MAALGVLFFWAVPESNKDIIIYMLGQLSGFVGAIVAFNYGTSKSSQDKNDIIHRRIDEPLELGGAEIE